MVESGVVYSIVNSFDVISLIDLQWNCQFHQSVSSISLCHQLSSKSRPYAPWCWYIYLNPLQNWVILLRQMLANIPAPWNIWAWELKLLLVDLPSGNLTYLYNITMFSGKIHYERPFSKAILT